MTASTVRVVKVGGSLLQFDGLVPALRRWLAAQTPAVHVLMAGGGALADAVRDADRRFALGEERAHWLCVEVLQVTARLLAALLPEMPLVKTTAELQCLISAGPPAAAVFCPADFLEREEPLVPGPPLPRTWSATSDSIAARLAVALGADELVLLKSADPPDGADPAGEDYVDGHFRTAARDVPAVRMVNLRK